MQLVVMSLPAAPLALRGEVFVSRVAEPLARANYVGARPKPGSERCQVVEGLPVSRRKGRGTLVRSGIIR
jgi:hypothetical protein